MKDIKNNSGFTLIELLVVIAIISILTSFVFSSVNATRMNARDAQRISDIRQLRIALELYHNANGTYPDSQGSWIHSYDDSWKKTSTDLLSVALKPYMPKMPVDPVNTYLDPWTTGGYSYAYYYRSSLGSYELMAQLENTSSPLRCEVKAWYSYMWGQSWCQSRYSPYIYTGEY